MQLTLTEYKYPTQNSYGHNEMFITSSLPVGSHHGTRAAIRKRAMPLLDEYWWAWSKRSGEPHLYRCWQRILVRRWLCRTRHRNDPLCRCSRLRWGWEYSIYYWYSTILWSVMVSTKVVLVSVALICFFPYLKRWNYGCISLIQIYVTPRHN